MKQERIKTDTNNQFVTGSQSMTKNSLANHAITAFFKVNNCKASSKKIVLRLSDRGEYSSRESYGCLVDYAARLLGEESLGSCFISEYEFNFQRLPLMEDLVVRAEIFSVSGPSASFHCTVTELNKSKVRVIAEASGTLCATLSAEN